MSHAFEGSHFRVEFSLEVSDLFFNFLNLFLDLGSACDRVPFLGVAFSDVVVFFLCRVLSFQELVLAIRECFEPGSVLEIYSSA